VNRVRAWYERSYPAGPRSASETSAAWREPLLNAALVVGAILGLPAALLATLAILPGGDLYRVVLFGVCYVAILVLAAARRLPSGLRSGVLLTVVFLLAVDALLATGLPGSGRLILIAFALRCPPVRAGGGLVTLLVSLAAIMLVAYFSSGRSFLRPSCRRRCPLRGCPRPGSSCW
jgi:hypothetical protein